eukprot:1604706-Pleurochrysis_carterae.AAC.1
MATSGRCRNSLHIHFHSCHLSLIASKTKLATDAYKAWAKTHYANNNGHLPAGKATLSATAFSSMHVMTQQKRPKIKAHVYTRNELEAQRAELAAADA